MNPLIIAPIVETVGKIADDLFTSDKERLDAEIELRRVGIEEAKLDTDIAKEQIQVNKEEAKHSSIFVAGARPAVMWVGVLAMLYQFVVYPLMVWGWFLLQTQGVIPMGMVPPPMLDVDALWVIITGVLGLGAYRTVDKIKGVATEKTAPTSIFGSKKKEVVNTDHLREP